MGQTTEYSYDPGGRIQTVKDGKGQVRTYAYDDVGRLSEIRYADGKSDAFVYDAVGNLTSWSGADGVSGSARYDAMNRKLSETIASGAFSKTIAYSYDAKGKKASYTSPEGVEHLYTYDQLGRPTSLTFAGQSVSLSYDKTRLQQVVFPGGVTTAYGYNASNWLSSINTVGPNGTILSRGYSFDQVGNITAKSSEHGAYNYGYDAVYQLTSAGNPTLPAEAFGYDQVGNRLSSRDVTGALSYNANNELIGSSAASYEYDANGNTVKKIEGTDSDQVPVPLETRYQYNARNRLEKVYLPDGRVASYRYDPFGRRVSKQVGNDTTYFVYTAEGLVGEYDATGVAKKTYGWKPNGLWGTNPLYLVEAGEYFFYHNDHLGTPQKLTDGSGNVAWSAGYAAFGLAVVDSASTVEHNLRFPGQYFDAETGEHYNFQRTYEPETGRYTQVDPIGFAGGDVNLFRYVQNNPINNYDPLGLDPVNENLQCHVCTHNNATENAIGGVLVAAPLLIITPTASTLAVASITSPSWPKIVEVANDVVSENLDGSPAGKYSPIINPKEFINNLTAGINEGLDIAERTRNFVNERIEDNRLKIPPGTRTNSCH